MAFHPYTQVIPQVFNPGGFGPPRGLTRASPCPCVDHPASGLQHATQRPIQTRFRFGYPSRVNLATHRNSLAHSSKGTPSRLTKSDIVPIVLIGDYSPQIGIGVGANYALTVCKPTVSGTISLPSRGAFHLSLTVLVRYRWRRVFSLGGWSPRIPTRFLVSRGTRVSMQSQKS